VSAPDQRLPLLIGGYRILGRLGAGGAGVVFRACDQGGRQVALKLLKTRDPDAQARFAREAKLLGRLGGEEGGVVPLLDQGTAPEGPFLVMPLLPGGDLRWRLLQRGRMPVAEALDLVGRVAEALGHAHELGIVHRDIKPENILFTLEGKPLVADLGLAKFFRDDALGRSSLGVSMSVRGQMRGTFGYMAPEQMVDSKTVGPAADVFGLGAVLYECLAGEPAFQGHSVIEVIQRVDLGQFTPLSDVAPDVPLALARVVERALSREPSDRYPDTKALQQALATCHSEPAPEPAPEPHDARVAHEPQEERRQTSELPLAAVLVPAALLLMTVGGLALGGGTRPELPPPAPKPATASSPAPPPAYEPGWAAPEGEPPPRVVRPTTGSPETPQTRRRAPPPPPSPDQLEAAERAEQALEALRSGAYQEAISLADQALTVDESCAQALRVRGLARAELGEFEAAREDVLQALELDPGPDSIYAQTGVRVREIEAESGSLVDVLSDLQAVIVARPGHVDALLLRVEVYLYVKNLQPALRDALRATRLAPERARAWELAGQAAVSSRRLAEGVGYLDQALELDPGSFSAWHSRGAARIRSGDPAGGVGDYGEALRIQPETAWLWHDRAVAQRDLLLDYPGAIESLEQALRIEPRDGERLLMIFEVHKLSGDRVAQVATLERYLRLFPDSEHVPAIRQGLEAARTEGR
jgi:serine/threonine protein kinase/tetratricopeptide (TPR) repeat protein